MKYFRYSLVFSFGLGLILLGLAFIIYFQLHYGSNPFLVKFTFTLIGLGVPIAFHGISGMLGYLKYSKVAGVVGLTLCLTAIVLFLILYPEGWYYPNVTLVATLYAFGLISLFGGLFGEAVQRLVERGYGAEEKREESLDFEEVKFVEPVEVPESEIVAKDLDYNVEFGPLGERMGRVVKVKDNVDYDADMLNRVRDGKKEVKVKDEEISEISRILRDMKSRMKKD